MDLDRNRNQLDSTLTALEEAENQHSAVLKELQRTQGLVRVLEAKADRRKKKAQSARLALKQTQMTGFRRSQTFQGREYVDAQVLLAQENAALRISLSFANERIVALAAKKTAAKRALCKATQRAEELETSLKDATEQMMEAERSSQELSLTLHQASSRARYLEEQLSAQAPTHSTSDDPCESEIGEFSFREEMDLSVRLHTLGDEDRAPDEESLFVSPLYRVGRGGLSISVSEVGRERLRVESRVEEVEIRRREWSWSWLAMCLVTCLMFSWLRTALGAGMPIRRSKQS